MKYIHWLASPFILISLTVVDPCLGQTVYSGGTTLPANASFQPPLASFTLDSNVSCPSPSLSVSAFGGNAYDRSRLVPDYNANGGSGNYGASVGFLIPISGELNQFCNDIATSRSTYEKLRVEAAQFNNYVEVAKACSQLAQIFSGMREDDPSAFYDNPQNAQLLPCRDIVKQILAKPGEKTQNKETVLGEVKIPQVESWQKEPLRVQLTNPGGLSR